MRVKPLVIDLDEKLLRRFLVKVEFAETGCWLWRAGCNIHGYGKFRVGRRTVGAHLVSYHIFVGPLPTGDVELDHTCRVRRCVNPFHVEPVTAQENVLRGAGLAAKNAKKTHCPVGHQLSGENLYVRRDGARGCRECKRAEYRRRYRRDPEFRARRIAQVIRSRSGV